MLALRLPEDIEKRLAVLAKKTGRTKSFYAREAIVSYIEDLEDIYLSEAILNRVRSGDERTFTISEVKEEIGLSS